MYLIAGLKRDILTLSGTLDQVIQLRPVQYQFRDEYHPDGRKRSGFIAQEVVITEGVDMDTKTAEIVRRPNEYLALNYIELIPIHIRATQEQRDLIENQEKEIRRLQNQNQVLLHRLNELEARFNALEKDQSIQSVTLNGSLGPRLDQNIPNPTQG